MAFFGVLAYLFFFFIRLEDWWGPLKGVHVDDIVICFILLFLFSSMQKWVSEILKLPQSKFLLMFVGAVFFSNIVNGNTDVSFPWAWRYLKFSIIFFAIVLSIDSFPKLKWLIPYILLLTTFIAYQCIIQAKTGTNWAGQSLYWADRARWVGLFDGANSTALLFVFLMPFLFEYLISPWNIGYKAISIASGYLLLMGFYLTNSRGGFISLLVVVFAFISTKLKGKKGIVFGLILLLALLAVAAPSRMTSIDDHKKSTRGRIYSWDQALHVVRYHNPFFGVGKGQFKKYSRFDAHNAFLQQLAETGLIGIFLWLGLIYSNIIGFLKILRKEDMDPLRRSLYRGYFLGLIGLVTGIMFIKADHELLYIWMALLTSVTLVEKIELRFGLKDLVMIGVIEVIGVTGAYAAVNLFKLIYF